MEGCPPCSSTFFSAVGTVCFLPKHVRRWNDRRYLSEIPQPRSLRLPWSLFQERSPRVLASWASKSENAHSQYLGLPETSLVRGAQRGGRPSQLGRRSLTGVPTGFVTSTSMYALFCEDARARLIALWRMSLSIAHSALSPSVGRLPDGPPINSDSK